MFTSVCWLGATSDAAINHIHTCGFVICLEGDFSFFPLRIMFGLFIILCLYLIIMQLGSLKKG